MSKRTRKPLNLEKEANQKACSSEKESPPKDVNEYSEEKTSDEAEDNNDHKSLKQLMIKGNEEGNKGRSSLGQHFTEEEKQKLKQIQVVVKQHEEVRDGVKFKRMVNRYAKVLSHLIKKKPVPRLTISSKG
ncbi:hypothetical protein F0562_014565 [Nyssa sinensis]|uniref:Uncharacterized protein n=1 Tax=Nyssa sinensis TaxID=561372 RepID=A0A5J4ZQM2_9ASTE|nr:hypothetical protein F0562_014565 [Nyssa sinensis]